MTRQFALLAVLLSAVPALGQGTATVTEGFDSVAGLTAGGWAFVNNTPSPNAAGQWRQGSSAGGLASAAFSPQAGAAGAYVRSDFTATTEQNAAVTVSDWLILPARTLSNGGQLTFYTRTNGGNLLAERLVVRMSTAGTSTNVGTGPDDLGDFTTALLTINPSLATGAGAYPDNWTQYTANISGLPGDTVGRLALHHYVTNGGPGGLNGDQLAVDTLFFNPVPEPAGLLAVAGLAASFGRIHQTFRRQRRRKLSDDAAGPV